MKVLRNNKGIALVMVMVLAGICLAVMAGLIYMVTSGTQVSGLQKRYKTALEGGMAGAEMMYATISDRAKPNFVTYSSSDPAGACLTQKLNSQTTATNWNNCLDLNKAISVTIDPQFPSSYDFWLDLGPGPALDPTGIFTYRVYVKVAETVEGNTAPDSGWMQGGVVWSKSEFYPIPRPYLYGIEVHAEKQNQANPERAKLSILYQH